MPEWEKEYHQTTGYQPGISPREAFVVPKRGMTVVDIDHSRRWYIALRQTIRDRSPISAETQMALDMARDGGPIAIREARKILIRQFGV